MLGNNNPPALSEYFMGCVSRLMAPMLCTGGMRWISSSIAER